MVARADRVLRLLLLACVARAAPGPHTAARFTSHVARADRVLRLLLLACVARAAPGPHTAARFTSHVSVHTPARSFTHGVGDLIDSPRQKPRAPMHGPSRNVRVIPYPGYSARYGYPRERPAVPFHREEIPPGNSLAHPVWQIPDLLKIGTIPVLPASPYRVNSPNPESLWPEGLFVPPSAAFRGSVGNKLRIAAKSDDLVYPPDPAVEDPYLLENEEALQALEDITKHGELFFHDIPHHRSLTENQQMRSDNGLEPHRLGSIRHSWIYYRP